MIHDNRSYIVGPRRALSENPGTYVDRQVAGPRRSVR
jgi:hypothetical protein